MASGLDEEDLHSLLYTPTWAVAAVCAVFIICSLAVERSIFLVGQLLQRHNQTSLSAALEKIKEELMVVGFISLALAVGQRGVSRICVAKQLLEFMPQCRKPSEPKGKPYETMFLETNSEIRLSCSEGKAPFISREGLHQLHILLFVLAIVHVVYCILIMALGMWKVHQWKVWEERAHIAESVQKHGQVRLTRDVTFIRKHASGIWSKNWLSACIAAFFQQFCSISETDYFTLRHGFIKKHNLEGFNFHKYILKTLEYDFEHVVGISPPLWGYMVLLTFLNVRGWGMYFWASFVPLVMVLAVGAKLRHVITQMAVQCSERHAVVEGVPHVNLSDELFWFNSPRLILYLIHFILFQDALELSLQLWTMFEFPNNDCFFSHHYLLIGRLILGAIAQLICGYVMLPIYALVSQMGSTMKRNDASTEMHTKITSTELHGETPSGSSQPVKSEPEGAIGHPHSRGMSFKGFRNNDLEKQGKVELGTDDIKDDSGKGSSRVNVSPLCVERRMSFMERMARGVHGSDYHALALHSPIERPDQ
ncbi:hypothetical protein KP509_04G021800 [Ceratopteris richardii]|uniref:MLO-like protein n=1 Tax=Ceratopteris richardii TaxID=49495 RepID=A0A8T2UYD7_CERRI|nr:hypothetical protein KP509_04G021800 [Ceratopteris richardii]